MLKSKTTTFFSIILLFLATLMTLISPASNANATNMVIIISHTGYIDSQGYYIVVGELQNMGNETLTFVKVEATYYDSQNNIITTRFDLTMLNKILPGRKSPFLIALLDTAQSAQVHHYNLTVSFSTTSPIPIGLEITSHSSQIDMEGYMHITGEIKNTQTKTAHNVKVIVTCYDEQGKVVAATQTELDPEENYLNPNETKPFELIIGYERAPLVYTYELAAESTEYAVVPEMPPIIIPLVLIILTITIIPWKLKIKSRKSGAHI